MADIMGFGCYLPARVLGNHELAGRVGVSPEWIFEMSGIRERRIAEATDTVVQMGVEAVRSCLEECRLTVNRVGMVIVASGSGARRFPGPAAAVARELGIAGTPCLDLPMASAGALFGMSLASRLVREVGPILLVASERMSDAALHEPLDKNTAILFGDGAGACLLAETGGMLRVTASALHSDGTFEEDLRLEADGQLRMNGLSVIMQASRKLPAVISEALAAQCGRAQDVTTFFLHQANRNLLVRVAKALGVPAETFYSNIERYGNTSSASMLIAAAECFAQNRPAAGEKFCFAAFGAGFHWGAVLAEGCG